MCIRDRGLGRAVLGQLRGNSDAGGASTITMQYVRNVLVQRAEAILDEDERDKAYEEAMAPNTERKLQEIRYAVSIETVSYTHLDVYKRQCLLRGLEHELDLDGSIERQYGYADGRTHVNAGVSENATQEHRGAVRDRGLTSERWVGCDEGSDLDDLSDLVERAEHAARRREAVELSLIHI